MANKCITLLKWVIPPTLIIALSITGMYLRRSIDFVLLMCTITYIGILTFIIKYKLWKNY